MKIDLKSIELSEKTRPGELGFRYALQYSKCGRQWVKKYQFHKDLMHLCEDKLGKSYQKHWSRKQSNRKWYVQEMCDDVVRVCFKSKSQRFVIQLQI